MSHSRTRSFAARSTADTLTTDYAALMAPTNSEYVAYAGIGSQSTPEDVCADMARIAGALEARGFFMRSGAANGADSAFEAGVRSPDAKEIFIPWRGFNKSDSSRYPPFVSDADLPAAIDRRRLQVNLDTIVQPAGVSLTPLDRFLTAFVLAESLHPAWNRCSPGARKLHTRNCHQILGENLNAPVRFVICWTKDGGPTGGTGQAMRLALRCGIPIINLYFHDQRAALLKTLGL